MSVGGLLLRVVLMLSLLLNGLNAALAGPMALAMATATTAAPADAAPPCHDTPPTTTLAPAHPADADAGAQAPHDDTHCRLKDCLRSCAQQPGLTATIAWLPSPPPLAMAPPHPPRPALPSPPLDRITRPPIG
ncbi:CopL family metal-binding regulatory protein [Stenotrophomonas sp.]|uniref:CopL family metal-binding regulatory protein n=1 Tax=Stenotrophomonas sp. TaxID=69392 RepID=UPI002FCBF972